MKEAGKGDGLERVIGVFKVVKSMLLIAAGSGMVAMIHKDTATVLSRIAARISVDPNAHYFRICAEKLAQVSPKLPLISIGMFFYAALFLVEGIGLLMRKRWAEYFTVIVTGSFMPLEIYELVRHATATRGIVLAVNLAIVIYLIWKIRSNGESSEKPESSGRHADSVDGSDNLELAR